MCGDARTRRAADGRDLGRRPSQVSKAAGPRIYCASPSTLVMTDPRQTQFARKHVDASECPKLGAAGARLVESSDFAHVTGGLREKCRDEALRERVRQELKWDQPPTPSFLQEEVQKHRERAKAPEKPKPPKRRPPRARSPPPPAKRSEPELELGQSIEDLAAALGCDVEELRADLARQAAAAAAPPAPLAIQDQDTGESAVVAVAPRTTIVDAANYALRALAGGTHVTQRGAKKVMVRKVGDKWQEFKSGTEADRKVPGLKLGNVSALLGNRASPELRSKFEARLISDEQPISQKVAFADFASAIGLKHSLYKAAAKGAASLNTCVAELVPRVVLPRSVEKVPESWIDLLKCAASLSELEKGVTFAQTRRAENERVLEFYRSNLSGGARDALNQSRRLAAEADAVADDDADAAWIQDAVFDEDGLVTGCTAQEDAVRVRFLDSWAPSWDNERVLVDFKGGLSEVKGGPWLKRFGWGWGEHDGDSGLSVAPCRAAAGVIDEEIALLRRTTPAHAIAMTSAAACGDLNLGHKGVRGLCTFIASPRQPPPQYIRKLAFDPNDSLRAMGLVRRAVTPATRHDGSSLDGFTIEEYDLCVPGQQWTMVDLRAESLRLRPLLLATTSEDRRIAGSTVKVSYRRSENVVTLVLCVPGRATRGPTERTIGVVAMLEAKGFPIYAWLTRRAIENCVPLEFLAYRDPTKGGKYHIDRARNLLLSMLMMTSATMKEAAKIDPLHSAAMLKGN